MSSDRLNFSYIRTATIDENKVREQRECIRRYRDNHPELPTNFEEVIDNGYSGVDLNAPGLKRILQLVEQNKVDTIIVSDVSRLSRNYIATGKYVENLFPAHGVRFIAADIADDISQNVELKLRREY